MTEFQTFMVVLVVILMVFNVISLAIVVDRITNQQQQLADKLVQIERKLDGLKR